MGIKKNVAYTTILTTSNYIFPLLVYPYVARVLGVTNIGLCNYVDNIINYFILFSMMGINIMGNRQIASDRAKGIPLTHSFSSLFSLNAITTGIASIVLVLSIILIPQLKNMHELMWFGLIKLISNFMLIEWFYKGIEDFKYITLRSIFTKCLYVVAIFLCVRKESDYPLYYLLTVCMVAANALINVFHSRSHVRFNFKTISFKEILKPFLMLGVYMLVTSLCTTFNVVYLGAVTDDTQVGYYTTATKLYSIFLAFFTGVTSVMLPRMSNLIALGKHDEFKEMLDKTTSLLFSFALPIVILVEIFTPEVILLISGPGYEGAITPMRLVIPLMLIIGYEQIMVIQGLMPLKKDKVIMFNACMGAIVSLSLNIILVKNLMSTGSAITWLSSEFTILILSQIALNKYVRVNFPFKEFYRQVLYNLPLTCFLLLIYFHSEYFNYWIIVILAAVVAFTVSLFMQVIIGKNPLLLSLLNKLKIKH